MTYWISKFEMQLVHSMSEQERTRFGMHALRIKLKIQIQFLSGTQYSRFHELCKYVTVLTGLHCDVFLIQMQLFFQEQLSLGDLTLNSHLLDTVSQGRLC